MNLFTSRNAKGLEQAGHIKEQVTAQFALSDDSTVLVTELRCREEGCPPVETVIAIFKPAAPKLQFKLHKPMKDISDEDVDRLCRNYLQSQQLSEKQHGNH